MALSSFEKIKVMKYIRETRNGEIYYSSICRVLEKGRKASYSELIEFFTKYVVDNFNKDNVSKNMIGKCLSCISVLLSWSTEIDEMLLGEIRLLKVAYEDYLKRNNIDKIEEIDIEIHIIDKYIKNKYPVDNEEQVISYINEISCLKNEVNRLTRELSTQVGIYDELNKKYKEQSRKLSKKNDEVNKVTEEDQRKKREIKDLNNRIKELLKKISELDSRLEQVEEDNNGLKSLKDILDADVTYLKNRVEELERTLALKEEALKSFDDKLRRESLLELQQAKEEEKKEKIKEIILARLTSGGIVLTDLFNELVEQDYEVSMDELFAYINEYKQELNIVPSGLTLSPRYVIMPPSISSNGTFDISIPTDCKSYDILLISDLHLSVIDEGVISDYNKLLDYCVANKIKIILNAGDFFCFKYPFKTEMLNGLTGSKKIVDKAISKLPSAPGLYQAILGGNHDKDALGYGFDAIKTLTDAREDFINLGYDHVTITFNGQLSLLHSFMLHHPSSKFVDPVLEEKFDNESLKQSLEDYYSNCKRSRNDSYLDIIGHFHRSGLDSLNAICNVPSLWHDRFNNGAWHMKVYFDELNNIKYIIFKPLVLNDKLVATTEIVYQKLVLK